jgi:peptidyl-prolyl cis-trans isomerase C
MPLRRFALIAVLLLAAACSRKPATPPEVIVRINERHITLADFKRYLDRNTGTDLAQISPEVASALLDQYTEEVLLSEFAAAHGVEIPADQIAEAVRGDAGSTVLEKRDSMRRQKLIADTTAKIPDANDAQVREFYAQNQAQFQSGEQVRVHQILVHDEALAKQIVEELRKGADFATLSVEHSQAANARRGGDIGFVTRGELPRMFEDVLFSLKPGEVSDVIPTDNSFHIFRVDERRPAGQLDLVAATPAIRARLRDDALREEMTRIGGRARRELQVAVLTKRLPFKYTGSLPKAENE